MIRWLTLALLLLSRLGWGSDNIVQSVRAPVTHGGRAAPTGWDDPLTNNLALRYWFDPVATNSLGKIIDTGGSNTGTLVGAVWTVIGTNTDSTMKNYGRVRHAYAFATDDYINCGNSATLNPAYAMTIAMWVYRNGGAVSLMIMARDVSGGRSWNYFNSDAAVTKLGTQVGTTSYNTDASALPNTTWSHVVWTYQTNEPRQSVYVNGALAWTNTAPASIPSSTSETDIGRRAYSGSPSYWFGSLTDVRLYGATLTAEQVYNLWYNTGGRYTNQPWMSDENGY